MAVSGAEPVTAEPPPAPSSDRLSVVMEGTPCFLFAELDFVRARVRIGGFRDDVRVLPRLDGVESLPFVGFAIFGIGMSTFAFCSDDFVLTTCGSCLVGVTRSICKWCLLAVTDGFRTCD